MTASRPALLLLEDGFALRGVSVGAPGTTVGEVVFNTSMTGYGEILTDPSYAGQIVTLTYPEIGNYGVAEADLQSPRVQAAGLVVRAFAPRASSHRAERSLGDLLLAHGTVAVSGVDTRALVRRIRTAGAMRGAISDELLDPAALRARVMAEPPMSGRDLVPSVAPREASVHNPEGTVPIVLLDCGVKRGILRSLSARGARVDVLPPTAAAADVLARRPHGLVLSNGPGDPAAVGYVAATARALAGKIPILGICLGHQILALSMGARTYKLKFGHRGGNQPVQDLATGRIAITAHNHGFAVEEASLAGTGLDVTEKHLNDGTVEGFRHRSLPILAAQYHPEASPGPSDAQGIFDRFWEML